MTRLAMLAAAVALGCSGQIEQRTTFGDHDPERGELHPGPEGDVPLPPESVDLAALGMDPDLARFLAAPPSGWTEVDLRWKVQNWTEAPMDQRFSQRGGEFRTEVHAGESRVEMRWEDWEEQDKEHLWTGEVRIEPGSTRTAIFQVKSNEDGEPIYIQIFNTSGDLRNNGDSASIARDMYDRWFSLKAAFNPRTGLGRAWIDDQLVKVRQYRTGTSGWYFKNGTYNNGLPDGGVSAVRFRNIKIYRNDGDGDDPPPLPGPSTPPPGPAPLPPGPGAGDIVFEAESAPLEHSGTGTTVEADPRASGGQRVALAAENAGSWMRFTTPSIPAGEYQLELLWKGNATRGVAAVRVDDQDVGEPLDQYAPDQIYPTTTIGRVRFPAVGTHQIRLQVVGQNAASSAFILSADRFILRR
jgi:hypothetical protein